MAVADLGLRDETLTWMEIMIAHHMFGCEPNCAFSKRERRRSRENSIDAWLRDAHRVDLLEDMRDTDELFGTSDASLVDVLVDDAFAVGNIPCVQYVCARWPDLSERSLLRGERVVDLHEARHACATPEALVEAIEWLVSRGFVWVGPTTLRLLTHASTYRVAE